MSDVTVVSSGGGPVFKVRTDAVLVALRDFVRVSETCRPRSGVAVVIRVAS